MRESRYGFAPEIDRDLFRRLEDAGLVQVREWGSDATGRPYTELYEVPRQP